MDFGLPYEEIIAVLKHEGIRPGATIASELMQRAIAEVITKNNSRIMEKVSELIDKEMAKRLNKENH